MKKALAALGCFFLLLVGCSSAHVGAQKEGRFHGHKYVEDLTVITDSETSCKYIFLYENNGYAGLSSITPLLKSDGTPDCD